MDKRHIAQVVSYFRKMGFFADATGSPMRIASDLADREDSWCGPLARCELDGDDPKCFCDLVVLKHDTQRVWRLESWEILFDRSAEKDGKAYCRDYGDVMKHLAGLTANRLRLAGESAKQGSMTVRFDAKKHAIKFRTDGGAFSPDFLAKVNEVIARSMNEFVFVSNRFCTGFILLLSTAEKKRLKIERKWQYWPLE